MEERDTDPMRKRPGRAKPVGLLEACWWRCRAACSESGGLVACCVCCWMWGSGGTEELMLWGPGQLLLALLLLALPSLACWSMEAVVAEVDWSAAWWVVLGELGPRSVWVGASVRACVACVRMSACIRASLGEVGERMRGGTEGGGGGGCARRAARAAATGEVVGESAEGGAVVVVVSGSALLVVVGWESALVPLFVAK